MRLNRAPLRLVSPLARAVSWTPLLVAASVVPVIALLLSTTEAGLTPDVALNLLRAAAVLMGGGAAFALADDMAATTGALPVPRWLRQWTRTVLVVAVAAVAWVGSYLLTVLPLAPSAALPWPGIALEASVLAGTGLAAAAFAVRRVPERTGAAMGIVAASALTLGSLLLTGSWSPWAAPGDARWDSVHLGWLLALLLPLAALALAHRDTRR